MNRANRYLANVTVLRSVRVAIVTLLVCICHHVTLSNAKVFERCELAQVLRYGHGVDVNDVANWVCIAQHSSSLNTSAFGGNAKSGSHGLFQISDEYWCSPPGKGVACGVSCDRLRDDDIGDDLQCVQKIHDEHQRLSGDGYNAWKAYELYCKENPYGYIEDCFGKEEQEFIRSKSITTNYVGDEEEETNDPHSRGKVYGRCELAKELFLKHKMPMDEIPTWVCIAQHESNYDTSAVGRLNADGSADHGLFQISDLFWCSQKGGQRKACGLPCSKFLDSDITDDVKCVKQIHKEHTRISGDGFSAWAVYNAHCHGTTEKYIRGCFDGIDSEDTKPSAQYKTYAKPSKGDTRKPHGKVYEPCELAEDLRNKYLLPEDQIATWVCIAKHESGYNTSAIGYGDHGLFQISDIYWCSPPGKGWACGLSCSDLEDSDISDDVACVRKIYDEHSHLSGDGFNAWTVYPRYCSNGRSEKYISHCPSVTASRLQTAASYNSYSKPINLNSIENYQPAAKKGKIYGRCELAKELLNKYRMPMEEIPTWVCIAHHESNFDTSAVGRLNADGSADHGLFQISDLFWCSDEEDGYGKACGLPCSKFLDSDISDDVKCVKQIHEEHTRISGDGFNAWTVYNAYCKGQTEQYTRGCFDGSASVEDFEPVQRTVDFGYVSKNKPKGKVYEDCELAKELRDKHRIPKDQISSWVCIAKHQSGLNTSASVAGSHGLFFISDEFWCSPPGKGKACELHCSDLEDSDITDDVQCVRKIYDEHQKLFGNGFNAWRAYDQYCSNGQADDYTDHCLGFESTARNAITHGAQSQIGQYKFGGRSLEVNKPVFNHAFNTNPFLKHVEPTNNNAAGNSYQNPFLKQSFQSFPGESFSASEDIVSVNHEYVKNPFLKTIQSVTQKPSIKTTTPLPIWANPFTPTSTASYSFGKQSTTKPPRADVKPFVWSTPPFANSLGSYQTMSEEKAKYEFFKGFATPSPPAYTVTPRANRLQPYNLNTIKPVEVTNTPFWLTSTTQKSVSTTPFWLTSTTPKPTNRFQFNEPSTQKSVAATPFWLTSTTQKNVSVTPFWVTLTTPKLTTQKSASTTPFWLTSTTPKPTNRFQFYESSTQKSVAATPFWLTSTTPKPTTQKSVSTIPFWLTSTTPKPTNRFQFYEASTQKSVAATPFWLTSTTLKSTTQKSFSTTPFWLTSTTPKPTSRFQFYESSTPKSVAATPFWLTSTTPKPTTQKSVSATPFWLTSTTPKPTNRFQFYESSSPKSVAATPFWLTSTTTPKPTNRFEFTTQKSITLTPFWLTSTNQKPTNRFQFYESSTQKSSTATPFWLASTTQKPTNRFQSVSTPFWLTSTTVTPTTNRKSTTKLSSPSVSSKINPLIQPTLSTVQLKTSTKPYTLPSPSATKAAPSLPVKESGQYNSERYDSGKYNSGKYEPPKNVAVTSKPTVKTTAFSFGIPSTSTTKSSINKFDPFKPFTTPKPISTSTTKLPWSYKAISSTTSKSTKYDPFHPFPPTTLKPKSTTVSSSKSPQINKSANLGLYVPYKPPTTTVKNFAQYFPSTTTRSPIKSSSNFGVFDPFKPFGTDRGSNQTYSLQTSKVSSVWNGISTTKSAAKNIWTTSRTTTPKTTVRSAFQFASTPSKSINTAKPSISSSFTKSTIKPSPTGLYSQSTTSKWTSSKPFSFSTIKPSTTTLKPKQPFSFQFTNPLTKVSSSTSRPISNPTTVRPYVSPTKTQTQKSTTSSNVARLQTIIPPWAITTTPTPTTTVINPIKSKISSDPKNNLYDLYFKLYGIPPPS